MFSSWLIGSIGWLHSLHQFREKRVEKAAKEKAEAALKEIRRLSSEESPFWRLSDRRFNGLKAPSEKPGGQLCLREGHPTLLCAVRDEVDRKTPAGTFVYLAVENHGRNAYEVSVNLDLEPSAIIEGKSDDGYTLGLVCYPYLPEIHGRDQSIKVSFLSAKGIRDTQIYATQHGIRTLKRTDPA